MGDTTEKPQQPEAANIDAQAQPTDAPNSDQQAADQFDVVVDDEALSASSGNVPLPAFLDQKRKWKQKVEDQRKSAEALKAENELLRMQLAQRSPGSKGPTMPTLESVDYDEAKFREQSEAYQRHIAAEEARRIAREMYADSQQQQRLQSREAELDAALSKHYERARKLGVDDFDAAENKVIELFGSDAAKEIIGAVDESHTLVYWLGKNPDKAYQYAQTIRTNPVKGILELGKLAAKIKLQPKPKEPISPDEPLTGSGGGAAAAYERKLADMVKRVQQGKAKPRDLIALRQEARQAGHKL